MHSGRSPYTDEQVARAKALLGVSTVKGVSRVTGIPMLVLRDWKSGKRRGNVQLDRAFLEELAKMVLAR